MIGQILALVCHALSDWILLRSLKRQEMVTRMHLFNALVITKMIFPVLGVFISCSTLVLVWFKFINKMQIPLAAVVFFAPAAVLFFGLKIFKRKPQGEMQ